MNAVTASEPFLILDVHVGTPVEVGPIGAGSRRLIPLTGGRVSGAFEGEIVPGGDWQTIHDDGNLEIAAHYAIRTTSGAIIEVQSNGVRTGSPEIMKRLMAGEMVDPRDYYFRTAVRMRTGSPDFAHLNFRLAIARGERRQGMVRLELFEVL